jgi:RNA polymerase sigma factor (sigma-70 family)
MIDDIALLRRYAEERSEEAFTALVRHHINLVYHAALRQTGGNATLAEDVTQTVFTDLARKAGSLLHRPVITGWLYTSTRFAAAKAKRAERRRFFREQESHLMHELTHDSAPVTDWERLRPAIDDALHALDERDREAVLMRFFEGRPFAEVGARLSLTEDTARVRVGRALDKMQALLARRGITSTSAALAVALANQAGVAAPAGLAASVTAAAMTGAATAAGTAGATFLGLMSTSKLALGVMGGCTCLAVGAVWFEAKALNETRSALAAADGERAGLRAKLRELEGRLEAQSKRASAAEEDNAKLLSAVQKVQTAQAVAAAVPITRDLVEARYKRAQELARTGQPEEALREYLWCYDEGMLRVSSYGGVRQSFLLSLIAKLGEQHPAALAALRERRDAAEKRMAASASDYDAASTFGAINRVLNENARTLAAFDQLPPDDARRRSLGSVVFDQLLEVGRYRDALQGRPYAMMRSSFEMSARERPEIAAMPNADRMQQANRNYVITSAAKNVEVLAGAGELADARTLANRLLAYDTTEATKALLQKHLDRAGQPELLKQTRKP